MTVYSCEFQSGPQDAAGNVSSSIRTERINAHAPGFASSSDYDSGAPTVLNSKTGDRRSVLSDADLLPDDVVEVGGIPMTVAQARSAGVEISVGEAGDSLNWQAPAAHEEEAPKVDLRNEGHVTDAEVVALENVVDAVGMHTGLDSEATLELGKDILMGEIAQDDVIWTGLLNHGVSRGAMMSSLDQVVQAGQAAAQRELGVADFNELNTLSDTSRVIKNLVVDHGIKRMSGKTNVTWKQVLTLARQFARS